MHLRATEKMESGQVSRCAFLCRSRRLATLTFKWGVAVAGGTVRVEFDTGLEAI